jgi:hypothetical protein
MKELFNDGPALCKENVVGPTAGTSISVRWAATATHVTRRYVLVAFHLFVLGKNITNSENEIFEIEQRKPHLAALLLAS